MKNLLKQLKNTAKNILTVITDESWKKELGQDFEFGRKQQIEGK